MRTVASLVLASIALAEPRLDPVITNSVFPGSFDLPLTFAGKGKPGQKKVLEPLMAKSGPVAVAATHLSPALYPTPIPRFLDTPGPSPRHFEIHGPVPEYYVPGAPEFETPVRRPPVAYPYRGAYVVREAPVYGEPGFLEAVDLEGSSARPRRLGMRGADATLYGPPIYPPPPMFPVPVPGPYGYPVPVPRPPMMPGVWY